MLGVRRQILSELVWDTRTQQDVYNKKGTAGSPACEAHAAENRQKCVFSVKKSSNNTKERKQRTHVDNVEEVAAAILEKMQGNNGA